MITTVSGRARIELAILGAEVVNVLKNEAVTDTEQTSNAPVVCKFGRRASK
jgi:hypothetical protein